jgi:DDE superfamily endonuclease/Helix-turn-helix of DDE superfamily endonuclease
MEYSIISKNATQFLALTSVEISEFESLLLNFRPICEKYFRYHTLEGKKRKIITSKEHGNASLKGTEEKLFFLLIYLKTNSLQEHHAAAFGISQAKVSRISRILLNLLNETLKKMGMLPLRDGELLKQHLANHAEKVFSYDGMERIIQRNGDYDAQEEEYSGKKKGHRVKNNLLCDNSQYIHYLSPTEPGSVHDKTIANEYPLHLPEGSVLKQDLGFVGHEPEGVLVEIPFKKPRNGELTFGQKIYNKLLNSTRVVIEHANSGVKRLKMLKDTIRIHSTLVRDQIIEVACGLHNFRTLSPVRRYKKSLAGT